MQITIKGLSKVYRGGIHALDGVDLDIPAGMFGLLEPNGAGKTTLMRILAGIVRPTSGGIHVGEYDGQTEQGRTHIKRILGYLPQDIGMYPDLTAREFLDYVGILKGIDERKVRLRRVDELLETVALTESARRKLKTFSGGMKRRVGIAQALLNDPKLLIVDPEERIRFRNLLASLSGDRTVLLSTHIIENVYKPFYIISSVRSILVLYRTCFHIKNDKNDKAQGKFPMITINVRNLLKGVFYNFSV